MTGWQDTETGAPVINLDDWDKECQICGEWRRLYCCVPFYEDPRPDLEIGQRVPGGKPDDIVGGMSCCKQCQDEIYGRSASCG